MAREVVVLSGVRTAIGGYGGSLKDTPPADLGAAVRARSGQALRRKACRHRPCRVRQHHPHRRARPLPGAGGGRQGRVAARDPGADAEPPVRQRAAGHHHRSQHDHLRRRRFRGRRRRREHEPQPLPGAGAALGRAHERRRLDRHDGRRIERPVRRCPHGRDGRERRQEIRHLARRPGRAGGGKPPARAARDRPRLLPRADRARAGQGQARHDPVRSGRDGARRLHGREAGEDETGLRQGGLGHGRQFVEHQRRGRGPGAGRPRNRRQARAQADGPPGRLQLRRRRPQVHGHGARSRRCRSCSPRRASRSTTSTCSRSTRPLPPRRSRCAAS